MHTLIQVALQFLTDRNWWQFHNPKNDAINVLVESCELAEHFVFDEHVTQHNRIGVAKEMADVLFASFICAQVNKIDIINKIITANNGTIDGHDNSYENINKQILARAANFGLENFVTERQIALSLVGHARLLADHFIWCTEDQSLIVSQEKQQVIAQRLVTIIAHLLVLSDRIKLDLVDEYQRKMKANALKYPVDSASGQNYSKIKDAFRDKNKSS